MNPLLNQTSSSFLTLNQLSPHCNKLLNLLQDARNNSKEKILYEQTLWNEVKKIRTLKDESIFLYLIGFYQSLLDQTENIVCKEDELFRYHVLIRIGDLNRYMECLDVAEHYYCSARNAFPNFGHAYNQLGLLTKPTNCYKCCYYYARAAKSIERPLNVADSNIRLAVANYDCKLLHHILNDPSRIETNIRDFENYKLPETALEWFYVIVIAIYADNIQPIASMFLSYIDETFSSHRAIDSQQNKKITTDYCDRNSYILLANLDIMLDWLMLGSQAKNILPTIGKELCQIKLCIQNIIKSCDLSPMTDTLNANSTQANPFFGMSLSSNSTMLNSINSDSDAIVSGPVKFPALPHDYVLKGFSPLISTGKDLTFEEGTRGSDILSDGINASKSNVFLDTRQLKQILMRLKQKLNCLGLQITRRRTRNIVLESILSNMEKTM